MFANLILIILAETMAFTLSLPVTFDFTTPHFARQQNSIDERRTQKNGIYWQSGT
uniref:Uncharacterized protein n=1 Tax=Xenopus tropicalis TaxID=8364 RepID=A0A1B8XV50_XENTR